MIETCSNQSPLVLCTTAVNAAVNAKQPRHVVRVSTWLGEIRGEAENFRRLCIIVLAA